MEHESILKLFDSFWFQFNILNRNTTSSVTSTCSEQNLKDSQNNETSYEGPKLTRIRTVHNRSMSDQSIACFNHDSLSPDSVLNIIPSKLQTILSGKEVTDSEDENNLVQTQTLLPKKNNNINKVVKKKRESKSLSDLEFEELKGFMDLGFVFSEEDKDSSLVEIIPGLQRLGKKNEEEEEEEEDVYDESVVQRPYLSEAWEVYDWRKKEKPLVNWKVPAMNNEIDMKNSLRLWAQTVASTVR
ncbi:hypothetical protein MtrunA17_Chr8g0379321 [Medicago truncatula]|uniref:DUF1685 family protein n=1 Tax=Medicago truncatula TaxID=3880 RepID=A0A396GNM8_MEDTR|nr:uncharacterized protein LOC11417998 [Medicago truncatula]RHN42660.1 hypothetical protein MtrunA17_Chr8g0379321 [Medicago truncatula]